MVGVDIVFLVSLVVGIDHSLKILMTDTPNFISTYDNVLSSEVIEVATEKLLPSTRIYEQL